jgi:hypothetical protein
MFDAFGLVGDESANSHTVYLDSMLALGGVRKYWNPHEVQERSEGAEDFDVLPIAVVVVYVHVHGSGPAAA